MITSFKVGNFKAFGEMQEIPLKPITLIFGPNSSGKSSVIHSLLFGCHAVAKDQLDINHPEGSGRMVDLGGFRQYVFRGRRGLDHIVTWGATVAAAPLASRLDEPVSLATRTMGGVPPEDWKRALRDVQNLDVEVSIRMPLGEMGEALPNAKPFAYAVMIRAGGANVLGLSRRAESDSFRIDQFTQEHPLLAYLIRNMALAATFRTDLGAAELDSVLQSVEAIIPAFRIVQDGFIPARITVDEGDATGGATNEADPIRMAIREHLPRRLSEFLQGLRAELQAQLAAVTYLGPLRTYPPRHLAFSEQDDLDWFAGGGNAWSILRDDLAVREAVNTWLESPNRLQTPYRLDVVGLFRPSSLSGDIAEGLRAVFKNQSSMLSFYLDDFGNFEEAKKNEDLDALIDGCEAEISDVATLAPIMEKAIASAQSPDAKELVLLDKRTNTEVSHRDVGIGISQVLPVLVNAYAHRNRTIAMEQPEIHLHPALQAELGDVFIESALGERKNRFVLETHSEHLILRILRRIREGKTESGVIIKPEDVAVLYVLPTEKGSYVKHLEISETGQFLDGWPGGFFPERVKEIFGG